MRVPARRIGSHTRLLFEWMPCLTFFGTVHSLESVTCATYAVGLLLIRRPFLLTEHVSFAVLDSVLVTNIACKAEVYGDRVLNRVVVDVETGDDEEAPALVDGLADPGEATLKRGKGEVCGGDRVITESLSYVVSVVNMWCCSTLVSVRRFTLESRQGIVDLDTIRGAEGQSVVLWVLCNGGAPHKGAVEQGNGRHGGCSMRCVWF